METKNCTLCLKPKPVSEYTWKKRECRECRNRKARKYYQENREEIVENTRQWKLENKDILAEKVLCECGCEVGRKNIYIHKRSEKHKNLTEGVVKDKKIYAFLLR